MKTIRKILVCVDLSDYSSSNLEYALALAGNTDAELILVNVLNQRDIDAVKLVSNYYPSKISVQEYIESSEEERNKEIRSLVKENFFDAKARMSIQVTHGVPYEEILKVAEKEGVDVIVIGNKGRTNLSRTLFGSCAEKVFRHSPVPVFSVRMKERFKRS